METIINLYDLSWHRDIIPQESYYDQMHVASTSSAEYTVVLDNGDKMDLSIQRIPYKLRKKFGVETSKSFDFFYIVDKFAFVNGQYVKTPKNIHLYDRVKKSMGFEEVPAHLFTKAHMREVFEIEIIELEYVEDSYEGMVFGW